MFYALFIVAFLNTLSVPFAESNVDSNGLLNRVYREFNTLRDDLSATKLRLGSTEKRYEEEKLRNSVLTSQAKVCKANNTVLKKQIRKLASKNREFSRNNTELKKNLELYEMHYAIRSKLIQQLGENITRLNEKVDQMEDERTHYVMLTNLTMSRFEDCVKDQVPLFCDFEMNECGFQIDENDTTKWFRSKISNSLQDLILPKTDHTCINSKGNFMAIKANNRSANEGRMYSKRLFGGDNQCLSFFYFVDGKNVGLLLNVIIEVPDEGKLIPVWRIYGSQGKIWIEARLNISKDIANIGYRIIFEGRLEKGNNDGIISVDDFNIFDEIC